MRMHFRRDDRVISYLDAAGPGPATPERTLVLLHAFPLAAEMWRPQLDAVPARVALHRARPPRFRAVAGRRSDAPGDRWRATRAMSSGCSTTWVSASAVIAGLSMGGYVAFALLRLAPERVAGLVLADTRSEADDETARASRDGMADTLARGGAAAVFDRMLPGLLGATTRSSRPEVVRTRAAACAGAAPGGDPPSDPEPEVAARLDAASGRHRLPDARRRRRRGPDHERGQRAPDARPDSAVRRWP